MPLQLRPMTPAEFTPWRAAFVREWGEDLARADDLPLVDGIARAAKNVDAELPAGAASPNHFLFVLVDGDQRVGTLWFSIPAPGRAFLDDVTVDAAHRGKGYGRQALALLEISARQRGCRTIVLNVYGHNPAALALYEKAGYATKRREMSKAI